MPEQHLKALSAAVRLTPLIAKLGFCPQLVSSGLGLLSLAHIMRNVPADTD
jgi:hypothetical protein